jgi:hypothetical protein
MQSQRIHEKKTKNDETLPNDPLLKYVQFCHNVRKGHRRAKINKNGGENHEEDSRDFAGTGNGAGAGSRGNG